MILKKSVHACVSERGRNPALLPYLEEMLDIMFQSSLSIALSVFSIVKKQTLLVQPIMWCALNVPELSDGRFGGINS
jgi:hypothetical protein